MQKNEQPREAWAGCYKIEYIAEEPEITEKELFDTVFSKLEKIKRAEDQLAALEYALNVFIEDKIAIEVL